jgi:hypothetical protein
LYFVPEPHGQRSLGRDFRVLAPAKYRFLTTRSLGEFFSPTATSPAIRASEIAMKALSERSS